MQKLALIITIFSILFSHNSMSDVTGLLEQVAEAYGGQENISTKKSFKQFGVTFSSIRKEEGEIMRAYRYPDHLRVEIQYNENASELRILAGPHAWKHDKPAGEPFYSAMLLQATRLGIPAILFEHQNRLRDIGTITGLEGKTLSALELKFHGNLRFVVGIDPESGRIKESHGILQVNGNEMIFGTTYADFRLQDGRIFAFEEDHYALGNKTGHTHIKRIEVTQGLPEELFHPQEPDKRKPDVMAIINSRNQGYF